MFTYLALVFWRECFIPIQITYVGLKKFKHTNADLDLARIRTEKEKVLEKQNSAKSQDETKSKT